jgi:hypothetical protein
MAPLIWEMKRERDSGVEVEVLPGISAFQKAASLLGAPIGHDLCLISLSDLMTPWEVIERRIRAAAAGDFVTRYCYNEEERLKAIQELGPDPEITRFKGLGEISPEEFAGFIGPDIRLEQVTLNKTDQVQKLLEYYMGKNTMERQNFIIDNLVIEEDRPEEEDIQ